MTEYATFRQRLDAVLRTLDVQKVQEFLQAEKQWGAEAPADPEFAMYMMIAGSSTLSDLHAQAQRWLTTHGHEEEARAVLGKQKRAGGAPKKQPSRAPQGQRARTSGYEQHRPAQNVAKRKEPRGRN
ncbi:MAG TPA: hypothetical protein VL485_25835 [Ktedonobacteraceae bacterium]|jgi:hypothetical protein|nr:hypothetical protein [Ktedonobacteraceae bacterium]